MRLGAEGLAGQPGPGDTVYVGGTNGEISCHKAINPS